MEIKFIGTGSGKTSLNRFHSSFIINSGNFKLLIDAGDGISKALINQNIKYNSIDGIIISHLHPDHFSGLGSLLVQMKLMNRKKTLKIFIHKSESKFAKEYLTHSYIFRKRLGFDLTFVEFDLNNWFNISSKIKLIARRNSHLDKYRSCSKSDQLKFISCSFFFNLKKKNIFYTGDIGNQNDLHIFKDLKPDIIICETTHIKTKELLSVIKKLNPSKIYLTHISDNDEDQLHLWKSSIPIKFQSKFEIASDGMSFQI